MNAYEAVQDCGIDSPSKEWLEVAESILTDVAEIDLGDAFPEDSATEIADQAVPVYTAEQLALVSSTPSLWTREPELAGESPNAQQIAASLIYEVASEIASRALSERQQAVEVS